MGLFGSNEITGIDIGAGAIKVVRIVGGGKPKILSAALLELPLDGGAAPVGGAALGMLVAGKKIGSRIVTQIHGKHLTIRHLTMPKMPLAELREAVRWEAKRHISYPLENAIIEHLIVEERHEGAVDKYDVLLVAVERNTALQTTAPFEEAKLKVSALDANALALRNVLRRRGAATGDNLVVVDLGAGKTEVNIYKRGGLRFSRCLETGGLDMTRAVAEEAAVGLDDAEQLKRSIDIAAPAGPSKAAAALQARFDGILLEIRRSVDYYKTTFRERSVAGTVLTGGVALTTGIVEYFSRALEGSVELDDPFAGIAMKKMLLNEYGPQAPRFSAAVGLGLRKA